MCTVGITSDSVYLNIFPQTGMPLIVMRNILCGKLCNGTRVILKAVKQHLITCTIETGAQKGEVVYLPRVSLEPSAGDSTGLLFSRRQFPVKPTFAITINKAQG